MTYSSGPHSLLYYRLRLFRRVLPLLASFSVVWYEIIEHGTLAQPITPLSLVGEILFFGIIGPSLIFLILTWLLRRVLERDEAEARLSALYEVSRQSASARGVEELQEIALTLPGRMGLNHAAASLAVQDSPGGPWLLAGSAGLSAPEIAALLAALASGRSQPGCDRCHQFTSPHPNPDCPLTGPILTDAPHTWTPALCLSLSREAARRVVLSVLLPDGARLPAQVLETLESMGAGLAVALDRARLQAHERQLLQQVERAIRSEQLGLVPTLQHILADIAAEQSIAAGAVYLVRHNDGQSLMAAACWPGPEAGAMLAESARAAVLTPEEQPSRPSNALVLANHGVVAVPITSEGEVLGVLVLADQANGGCLPEQSILGVVTSMMALLIRNGQLYGQLESQAVLDERNHLASEVHDGLAQSLGFLNFKVQQVQRLLARGQAAEATAALQELRDGGQEVYAEVRLMIQGLRWMSGDQVELGQRLRQYGSALATRTGLAVIVEVDVEPQLSLDAQLELFRVAQEALNNVSRHAHARRVRVRLGEGPEGITLTVEDDGIGLQPLARENGDHLGLRIMRERVQSIGGKLEVESRPGEGTALRVRIPSGITGEGRKEESWSASES